VSYTIKVNAPLTVQQVHDLYQQTHFDKPIADAARLQVMIDETQLVLSVWDDEHLIGFARCLTDFEYCCYLSDILILPAYEGHQIGRQLIATLQAYIGPRVTLSLRAADSAVGFYERINLPHADNMFRIGREG
jgi:GNAT superfamily N-acetyltransferase